MKKLDYKKNEDYGGVVTEGSRGREYKGNNGIL